MKYRIAISGFLAFCFQFAAGQSTDTRIVGAKLLLIEKHSENIWPSRCVSTPSDGYLTLVIQKADGINMNLWIVDSHDPTKTILTMLFTALTTGLKIDLSVDDSPTGWNTCLESPARLRWIRLKG